MVTQQEFISALLEPLPAAMAPLALADAPGAVVRGKLSGQSFSEAFGNVMADPTSMEGRVYGEDVTGDPYSGMVFELLTDPTALASLGTAGLGMALSRRAFLKRAGAVAAAAGMPGGIPGVKDAIRAALPSGGPGVPKKAMALMRQYINLEKKSKELADNLEGLMEAAYKEGGRHNPEIAKVYENFDEVTQDILEEQGGIAEKLVDEGYWAERDYAGFFEPEPIDTSNRAGPWDPERGDDVWFKRFIPERDIEIYPEDLEFQAMSGESVTGKGWLEEAHEHLIDEFGLPNADYWNEITGAMGYYPRGLDSPGDPVIERIMERNERMIKGGGEPQMSRSTPPGRGPRPGLQDIRPVDYELLMRLIREMQSSTGMQAPGGRYGY